MRSAVSPVLEKATIALEFDISATCAKRKEER